MKKILFYTDTPQIGGAELQIFLLAKFLDKSKFEVVLACSGYESLDKWCAKFENEGIKVLRMDVRHKHDPKHYFQLKKIIKEEEINILHAHIWNPASCRYAFRVAKSSGIPIITTEHDPFKLSFLKNLFKKLSLKTVGRIVAVSEANKEVLCKLYPEHANKISVIKNGIDLTWWQSQNLRFTDEDRRKIKEKIFQANENSLIIISIAELHERKGQAFLLEAVPEIVGKYPNVKFVLVGEGPNRESLEMLVERLNIEKNVILLGRQKEIPKLLRSSDIFVLPSRREAFGLVNVEAMISELPVVASNVGGIPEIVEDGKTGILVEPENPDALVEALEKLIADPELREKMGRAGYERVLKKFDAKVMADEYEKIYDDVV